MILFGGDEVVALIAFPIRHLFGSFPICSGNPLAPCREHIITAVTEFAH